MLVLVVWLFASTSFGQVPASLTISSPPQYKTFQRTASTGSIMVSGSYRGTKPEHVECSFNGSAYAVIVFESFSDNSWSGLLSSQAQGQGTLTCREADAPEANASVFDIGIGDVFLVIGDSNAQGRGQNMQRFSSPLKVTIFNQAFRWTLGNDTTSTLDGAAGSIWPYLGSLISIDQQVPIAFITAAVPHTDTAGSTNSWDRPGADYGNALSLVSTAGTGGVKGVLASLGPNAVINETTLSLPAYKAALNTLASNFSSEVTTAPAVSIPIFGEVGTGNPPDRRAAEDNIRGAILQTWRDASHIYPGAVLIDQNYVDHVHWYTDEQLNVVARRWWAAIKEQWYDGNPGFGRGPRMTSAVLDRAKTRIMLTIDRPLSSDATYSGFRVKDGDALQPIASVERTGANALTITLRRPISSTASTTVSFASGDDAAGKTMPMSMPVTCPDFTTITLPLEPFYDIAVTQDSRP